MRKNGQSEGSGFFAKCRIGFSNMVVRWTPNLVLRFWDYVKASLWSGAVFVLVVHPWIVFVVLMHFNVVGDVVRNYLCLALLLLDFAAAFVGGVYMQGRMKGEF